MSTLVPSLEWSKKLKEAGWPMSYSDLFGWWENADGEAKVVPSFNLALSATTYGECFPAPTAEEILRKLPAGWEVYSAPSKGGLLTSGYAIQVNGAPFQVGDTLANAAAAAYCYLAAHPLPL
jgi:hypothetical protein